VVGGLFIVAMTDTAPGKKIRAVAHIQVILVVPPDEFQVLVFNFHLAASRALTSIPPQPRGVNQAVQIARSPFRPRLDMVSDVDHIFIYRASLRYFSMRQ